MKRPNRHALRREIAEVETVQMSAPGVSEGPSWTSTPTGERILAGLRYAQFTSDIVVIYGGAGLGKSHCVRHYSNLTPSVFSVELSPATGSLTASLQEICRSLDLRVFGEQNSYMHRAIKTKLRGTTSLLVVDEAQELSIQALDQIRCIHDQARIGVALVGNEQVYAQIAGAKRAAYLDRLHSRIGKRIHIPCAVPGDAAALIAAWGISDPGCRYLLSRIAARPGAFRLLRKVLTLASAYAEAELRHLSKEDVDAAWADLGGL